jgi:AcrR family transcriptional regulator
VWRVPRITAERREARRAEIVAAARRCFSRDGFHRTSMPDIAAEAGLSVGAPYRYFAGKEEVIVEIATQTFGILFTPMLKLLEQDRPVTVTDLVASAVEPLSEDVVYDAAGEAVPVHELLRCGVQAWAELLRNNGLRRHAELGVDYLRKQITAALRHGQKFGTVAPDLDPERGSRIVVALLHGFILQRAAFGLDDCEGFVQDIRSLLDPPPDRR